MKIGLSYEEVMQRTQGEIVDLLTCRAIANGAREKVSYSFDEVLGVR